LLIHISHKSSGQVWHFSFSSIISSGQLFVFLHSFEHVLFVFQFSDHKSHSSHVSSLAFQHSGFVFFTHVSEQDQFTQFSLPSSHSSSFSTILFQHFHVVFLQLNEHFQSYQFSFQLSHSSRLLFNSQSQHLCKHFNHKSIGQVLQSSHWSIFQFQQFGLLSIFFVHSSVQLLSNVQFLLHSSHISVHSGIQFQHICFGFIILQFFEHIQLCPLKFVQLSHSSHGSTIPLPHDHVHLLTSVSQFLQSSAASILLFQQNALHSQTSSLQVSHVSSQLVFQSQHFGSFDQSSLHFSHKSSGQLSQSSPLSYS
jgi:hypothetical protein